MKFLQSHRKDLMQVMQQNGFEVKQFDHIKRKGRIHIIDPNSNQSFAYFRRKSTQIHPETKQWVESEIYEVSINGATPLLLGEWKEVVRQFELWVEQLRE